jgi:nucleoside-diphosphate-sugar epimerase
MSVALVTGSPGLVGSEAAAYFADVGMDVVGIESGSAIRESLQILERLWYCSRIRSRDDFA